MDNKAQIIEHLIEIERLKMLDAMSDRRKRRHAKRIEKLKKTKND